MCDVVALQTIMHIPLGEHLKKANSVLRDAVRNKHCNGLHFHYVGHRHRLVQITDSGHITQHSCYPVEGRMVLLMSDPDVRPDSSGGRREWYSNKETEQFGGKTCCLYICLQRKLKEFLTVRVIVKPIQQSAVWQSLTSLLQGFPSLTTMLCTIVMQVFLTSCKCISSLNIIL